MRTLILSATVEDILYQVWMYADECTVEINGWEVKSFLYPDEARRFVDKMMMLG